MVFFLAKFLYFLTSFLAASCVAVVPLVIFRYITSPAVSAGLVGLFSSFPLFFGGFKIYCIASWSSVSKYPAAISQSEEALFFLFNSPIFVFCCFFIFFFNSIGLPYNFFHKGCNVMFFVI